MKLALNLVILTALAIAMAQTVTAQNSAGLKEPATGIATLFARDPLTQSLCFKDGGPGSVFQDGQTKNRCSDLNFNSYSANGFSVGVDGGKQGAILDLGTPEELKAKYGFSETVGNGQGFASIDVRNGKALILKDAKTAALQPLAGADVLFATPIDSYASIPVKLGHVYLLRITDTNDRSFEMLAKVLVVAYAPTESVTVRWQVISNNETAKR